jgi:Domain of unknown function (DUF4375)
MADVIATDEATPMGDGEFDDAVWMALCGRVDSPSDLADLPPGVRMYYATRLVECEVGNGGFSQAVENVVQYFDEAIAGYRLLDDDASAELLASAQGLDPDDPELGSFDERVDGPPWNGVPWSDDVRVRYVRQQRDDFPPPLRGHIAAVMR